MMSRTQATSAAVLALLAGAGSASASTSVLTFVVTNNTSQAWTSILFEIRAPLSGNYTDAGLAAVLFDSNLNNQSTTQPLATTQLEESAKDVRFNFNDASRQMPGMTATYTVTIDNPQDSEFRIVRIATPVVPAPAGVGVAGLTGLVALRRRRAA